MALGSEPTHHHEQYAILAMEPEQPQDQAQEIIHEVVAFLQHEFPVRVVSAFPSPLGLGLFQFENPIQRECLLDASPFQFGQTLIHVQKHDEARNFRACPYIRESWIMFLGFPLDYQLLDFIKAAVAPFGRLITWLEGSNKSRVLAKCLLLSPNRVPRSIIVSQGSLIGRMGRSWTLPTYILNGHFPDGFPHEEDPVPFDGNPYPPNAQVNQANPNAPQDRQHDLHDASNHVHNDVGLNADQMADIQNDLLDNDNA